MSERIKREAQRPGHESTRQGEMEPSSPWALAGGARNADLFLFCTVCGHLTPVIPCCALQAIMIQSQCITSALASTFCSLRLSVCDCVLLVKDKAARTMPASVLAQC